MMTQTHLLAGAALFARPGASLRNTAVIIGSLIPDAAIYTLFIWSKVAGIPESEVWREIYWQEPWQTWTAAGNSFPLIALIGLAGVTALRVPALSFRIGLFALFFALAAFVHIALDFPVHNADAHRHFWPITDWKFYSPVSYWNPQHYGDVFSVLEAFMGVALALVIFRRFKALWLRALLILVCLAYIAVPVYFTLVLGGS